MSKKLISLLLTICMLFCLSACDTSENKNTLSETQTDTYQISDELMQKEPEENKEIKLSTGYRLLCAGMDGDDYYEVVYKEEEDYTGLTKYAGLIKNNQWDEELSESSIFLGRKIAYVGKGCFMLSENTESSWYDPFMCIYNAKSKQKYLAEDDPDFYYEKGIDFVNADAYDEELIIVGRAGKKLKLLNKSTMNTHIIEMKFKTLNYESLNGSGDSILNNICDGVFSIADDDSWTGHGRGLTTFRYIFFDINGNEILNLMNYAATSNNDYFKNGQLRLGIRNSNNTNYTIVIDKNGNVIDSMQGN